ncbi:MAG: Stk1 family PASTA domain-containing Ser/Thr kinase [Propionibacteriaceae bacterium]|jgi:serine/threonine-protein kinase|nr:Stk1 family PASTA domain-containing Ser/Thr kinase [Propionibacteriaceae bacterium]
MTDNLLLGERYILGPLLGRGGMAEVRRGRDIRLEREVAIKRLRPDLAGDAVFQARFRREAQAAAGLNHPNIVSVYDTGEQFDPSAGLEIPYIVMELVVGHTLRGILRDGRRIQPERALELTTSVLNALDYSHRHGIVHRDIKPANVMVTANGQVKVMDFGIARAVSDTAASMTQTAAVIGTPQYLSPEQIRGETVDRRADIYSTGCLLYELLSGRPPFLGDEPVSLAYQHVRELPVPPSQIDPVVTPLMDAIVLKALEKDPANRYQTAREMAEDIQRLLAGQQVTAVIPVPAQQLAERSIASDPTQLLTNPTGSHMIGARGLPDDPDADDEEEEPRVRKGLIALIASLTVVLAAIVIAIILFVAKEPPEPVVQEVSVPSLKGLSESTAEDALKDLDLVLKVETENGPNDDTKDKVTRQDPQPNVMVAPDSVVTVWINTGPKKGTIPFIIGKDKDEAAQMLKEAGFASFKIEPAPLDKYPYRSTYVANQIIDCAPAPGQETTVDAAITAYYDSGQGVMPNLGTLDKAAAAVQLDRLGFRDVDWVEEETTLFPEGTAFRTDPVANTTVGREDRITVYIAKTPTPPTPPPDPSPSPSPSPSESGTSSTEPTP